MGNVILGVVGTIFQQIVGEFTKADIRERYGKQLLQTIKDFIVDTDTEIDDKLCLPMIERIAENLGIELE